MKTDTDAKNESGAKTPLSFFDKIKLNKHIDRHRAYMFSLGKPLFFLFALLFCVLITQESMGEHPNPEPSVMTNSTIMCFSPNKLTNSINEKIFFPESYEIEVDLHDVPDWLNYVSKTTNDYKTINIFVKPYYRNFADLKAQMLKTCLAKRENGEVGKYDVPGESGPPADLYEFINCEWDPGSDSTYTVGEINKFAYLENKIPPDSGNKTYTLFQTVSTNNVPDVDYYLLYPRSRNYNIWVKNQSNLNNSLKVSIIQSNEVKKTKIVDKSSDFVLSLSCSNLNEKIESYVKVEHPDGTLITNKQYSLYAKSYYEVKEGKEWDKSKVSANFSNGCQQVIYTFKPLNKNTVFEVSSDVEDSTLWNNLDICFFDKNYQQHYINNNNIFNGRIKNHFSIETNTNGFFKRFNFTNLQVSNTYYCVVKSNSNFDAFSMRINARVSRIKPVFLVHGIDSSPKSQNDPGTAFDELRESYPYFDIRPFKSYDFIWDSAASGSILDNYVGNVFGSFISDNRKFNDLKGTIVAHSMGCLLTYYQCKEKNTHFKQNIDNIVLAAPPFFGSATANAACILNPISPIIKKTSSKNLELLSRGTAFNWDRHKYPFVFNHKNISVLIGTDKHATIYDVAVSTFDSASKLTDWNALTDMQVVFDATTDFFFDFFESALEVTVDSMSRISFMVNPIKTSEIYYLNRSDGVVGTYSAHFNDNIDAEEINQTHSYVQKFNSNNNIFVNKVKSRINNLGD